MRPSPLVNQQASNLCPRFGTPQIHHRADAQLRRIIKGADRRREPVPSALIRYKDWIRRSGQQDSPWGGGGEPVPVAAVRAAAERSLADAILVSGDYRQHSLPEGALLSEWPIADTEVHLLLDGLLLIEIDQGPV